MMTPTPNAQKILIVDDETEIREGLAQSVRTLGYDVTTAQSGEEAIYQLRQSKDISFVLTDFKMPGLDGLDVVREAKKTRPDLPVVMMTGFGSVHHAVNAMQAGAKDYLCKPFRTEDLEKIIIKNIPTIEEVSSESLLTTDTRMKEVLSKARRAALSNAPILIEGPSGTGKELLARQVHEWSPRRSKPWVAINCAALPSGLLESELFGFEKGAFTGATEKKVGKFEQADGGTLLLDEIGELDPILQAKLLRALQEGEVDRLGGKKPAKVDVRVIATTNRSLSSLVKKGQFREDLYFRLYGVRFEMPALRDRPGDIELLAKTFLQREEVKAGRSLTFAEGVLEALMRRHWSGNIRELERAVERACILCEDGMVALEDFEFEVERDAGSREALDINFVHFSPAKPIRDMERDIILRTLEAHEGNRTHTAKALGMSLRTLRHKLKQYREDGIGIEQPRQSRLGKVAPPRALDAALDPEKGY